VAFPVYAALYLETGRDTLGRRFDRKPCGTIDLGRIVGGYYKGATPGPGCAIKSVGITAEPGLARREP
jgi:hypothetical protein